MFSPLLLCVSRGFFLLRLNIFACDLNVSVGDSSRVPVGDNQDNSRDVPPAAIIPLNSEVEKPSRVDEEGGGGTAVGAAIHPIILPMSRFAL